MANEKSRPHESAGSARRAIDARILLLASAQQDNFDSIGNVKISWLF